MSAGQRLLLFLVPLAVGFALRGRVRSAAVHFAVTDLLFPVLVFYLLVTEPPALTALGVSAAALFLHIGLMIPLAFGATWLLARQRGEMVLPIMFMNSGFMGIAATYLWGGKAAAGYAVLYDQAMTFAIYTIGLAVAIPGGGLQGVKAVGRAPAFWAFVVALVVGALGWKPPATALLILQWIGMITVPAALFAVGLDLSANRRDYRVALPAAAIRLAGGTAAGIVSLLIFSGLALHLSPGGPVRTILEDPAFRRMIWIESIMPSAVFSAVLPARYGAGGSLASAIVLVSTLLFPLWFLLLIKAAPAFFVAL